MAKEKVTIEEFLKYLKYHPISKDKKRYWEVRNNLQKTLTTGLN